MKSKLDSLVGIVLVLMTILSVNEPAFSATPSTPTTTIIIHSTSSWGRVTDSLAGYTGSLSIWVPTAISNGWTLRFQSTKLGRQIQTSTAWGAKVNFEQSSNTFVITSQPWNNTVPKNTVLTVGFNARGVLNTSADISKCTFNGLPCTISIMSTQAAQKILNNLTVGLATIPNRSSSAPAVTSIDTPSTISATLEILFSVDNIWGDSYTGNIAIKNLSNQTLPSGANGWKVILKFPDAATAHNVFQSGPWNFQISIASDGTTTLLPAAWAVALPPGGVASSGFNGMTPTFLRTVTSASPSQTVAFASSISTDNVTPDAATATANTFLFSPYKDISISLNWGTNVLSSAITGTLRPLLNVIPSKLPSVTWAFASGDCGSEKWSGIQGESIAQANVRTFTNANVNYVISTGGAMNVFTCTSVAGMKTFINRYTSKNLVGIDFDIERGQTQEQIASLVRQVGAVQALYPNLRFSFTIATVGSSNGKAISNPYGDLTVTGNHVIQAIQQQGLINYTINLMTMDYGIPGPSVCVVDNGTCDMGKTAIQAAKNLKAKYGIPYNKIELTPMIGMNDITNEIFMVKDIDTISAWALSNKLAGIHFWSFDRDMPCTRMTASPTCSSVSSVAALGYTNRFISDLGL
ncbi:Cellulose-binding protein [Gammaproteobacteria bacterium]